jgi:multicomponent Na+:H+ antiporter subunit F
MKPDARLFVVRLYAPGSQRRSANSRRNSIAGTRVRSFRESSRRILLHEIVFYLAFVWMTVLLVVSAAAVIWLRSTAGRILALDLLTLILVALLVLYADSERSSYYMDAALVLSLLAFLATLALARYHGERRIF